MKRNYLIVSIIIATAVILVSCNWFNRPNQQLFSITGKWIVDSIAIPPNLSGEKAFSIIALGVISQQDSTIIQFNADGTYKEWKDPFSRKYHIQDSVLFAKEGADFVPYKILSLTDSSFNIISKDSIIFFFKKP